MAVILFVSWVFLVALFHQYVLRASTPPPVKTDRRSFWRYVGRVSRNWLPLLLYLLACLAISGDFLAYFGTPHEFRDDGASFSTSRLWGILLSPAIWSAAALGAMLVVIFTGAYIFETGDDHIFDPQNRDAMTWSGHKLYIWHHGGPLCALVVLAQLIFEGDTNRFLEAALAIAGLIGGFISGLLLVRFAYTFAPAIAVRVEAYVRSVAFVMRNRGKTDWQVDAALLAFLLFQLAVLILFTGWRILLSSIASLMVFGWIAFIYYAIRSLRPSLQVPLVTAIAAAIIFANGLPAYKHKFDDFEDLYEQEMEPTNPRLVEPIASLNAWHARLLAQNPNHPKPPLVVFALSGGGYRAGFWSAIVLDKLLALSRNSGSELYGLMDHTRYVAGSSGGMVAGAYFVTQRRDEFLTSPFVLESLRKDTREARATDPNYRTFHPLERDSLSPVTQHLVQRDLLKLIIPGLYLADKTDRGEVLERQWINLSPKLTELADGEKNGWRPSIVFSPMLADIGRQLLISNLELPETMAGEKLAVGLPLVHERIRISTATRMNASFAFFSPAVPLPGPQRWRAVDAGYFDNYGVQTLVGLLRDPDTVAWIQQNASGIIVVRVNALAAPDETESWFDRWLRRAGESFTSPITALVSAYEESPIARDNIALEQLNETYKKTACIGSPGCVERDWILTVDYENRIPGKEGGVSWYTTLKGLQLMQNEINEPHNSEATEELAGHYQALLQIQ